MMKTPGYFSGKTVMFLMVLRDAAGTVGILTESQRTPEEQMSSRCLFPERET